MSKINLKIFITLFLLLSVSPIISIAQNDIIKLIKFAKGKSSATVRGAVLRDEIETYIIKVNKGQKMTVKITAIEKNGSFSIEKPSGDYLQDAGEMDDQTVWSGTVPESGVYKIQVAPTRGNATYRLTVSVK